MSRQIMPKFDFKEMMNKTVNKKSITNEIPSQPISLSINENSEDFLSDLDNDKFISKTVVEKQTKEEKKKQKEQEKEDAKMERQQRKRDKEIEKNEKLNKKQVAVSKSEENELFSEKGSELYGKDRLQIIAKIQQYKLLFPELKNLQKLKVKAKASIEELHGYLAECEALVETDTLEQFLTDSILQTFKVVEYASVRTKYNISGLSLMLKSNVQFNSLSKQLYLKYKVFSAVPPEYQMVMLLSTSAWICFEKNKKGESKSTHTASMNKVVNAADFNDSDNEVCGTPARPN